jgi:hypothetical protein|tara:strand:+ start:273 stop:632 length:360 start_codon:yes stop_codon:yes gene_type:complete
MKPFTSKHCTQYLTKESPFRQNDEEKRVKFSTGGDNKYNDRSTEYIRGNRPGEGGRIVKISQGTIDNTKPAGKDNEYNTRTVHRIKKDGTVNTSNKKISKKRAERIKKRKDESHKEISQ